MGRLLFRALGHKAAHRVLKGHTAPGGALDLRTGFAMLRDRSVPVHPKILALGIGIAVTAILMALEAPLEFLVALFLPFFGLEFDLLVDGIELLVVPVVVASFILPRLTRTPARVRVISPRR